MIYDTFLYHGEDEILEIRFNILNEKVDKFIIVESKVEFDGRPHKLLFDINKFSRWKDKIIYYVIGDLDDEDLMNLAKSSPNVGAGEMKWVREFYIKESFQKAFKGLEDEDIVFISDLDEIWNPTIEIPRDDVCYKLEQLVYVYWLNNRSSEPWSGTFVATYKNIRYNIINHLRYPSKSNGAQGLQLIQNGGWHFTSQGGLDKIRQKVEFAAPDITYYGMSVEQILEKAKNNEDVFNRGFKFWVDETDWPQYLKDNREKYTHLLK